MNTDYIQEAHRQLSNTAFYIKLDSDPTQEYKKELNKIVKELPPHIQEQILTNTPTEPRPGTFYLLPKIHKPGNPGRPIISGIGTITVGVSGYMDTVLKPYAISAPSYVRDTTDFLRKIQSLNNLPNNTILATMDVESLYTNIPHNDGLQAIRNTISDKTTADFATKLCQFVLTHNNFKFGDDLFLQISGTAMGTRMAPQYANIFMADLEQRFLNSYPLKPLLYLRYIDDIFIIWTHGQQTLDTFHQKFNDFHPTINLTMNQSMQEIHFLDTTIKIQDGRIDTTLYRKPTDRQTYLHASSYHPKHTKQSIVYSQALRYSRICSNSTDRDSHLRDLQQTFLELKYPADEVRQQINRARLIPRENLLQDRPKKENNRTPLVITYSSQVKTVQRIIRDLQPLLDNDSSLSQALGGRPFIAYRQPPNLKQLLTHNNTTTRLNTDTGTRACNKPRCQLCCHIHPDNTITGPNNITHTISGLFNCSSSNIVYAIKCQQCPSALYIGQTGQTLRQRINGHKSDIKNHKTEKPVGEHFNLPGHSIQDLKVAVLLQRNFRNRLEREAAELQLITKLKTMERPGLNKDIGFLSHYT